MTMSTKKSQIQKTAGQKGGEQKSKKASPKQKPVAAVPEPAPETKPAPAPVTPEAPQQPEDSNELVVFAFRLTRAERDEIHGAAGSAKASKFVRSVALAAARRDTDALAAAIQDTEQNQKG
jgi:hypothetical protein